MRTHEEAAMEWFASWNRMDRQAFFALLAPGFVAKGVMAPQGVDGETIWRFMVAFRETFPDQHWESGQWLVSDRHMVVCEVIERGTFAGPWPDPGRRITPTHRAYVSDAAMLFRFDADGLIVENKSWYDSVDWFHQIGVDPNVAAPPGEVPDDFPILVAASRDIRER
jgi:SnoaL-like domain